MTAEELSIAAGTLLSLGFSYLPGLSGWYSKLTAERKRLVMLGLLALVALAAFGLACLGEVGSDLGLAVTCNQRGALGLLKVFVMAAIANQAAFLISTRPAAFRLPRKTPGGGNGRQ